MGPWTDNTSLKPRKTVFLEMGGDLSRIANCTEAKDNIREAREIVVDFDFVSINHEVMHFLKQDLNLAGPVN